MTVPRSVESEGVSGDPADFDVPIFGGGGPQRLAAGFFRELPPLTMAALDMWRGRGAWPLLTPCRTVFWWLGAFRLVRLAAVVVCRLPAVLFGVPALLA